ncbi:PREDICTED: uncharacterized protein DDB_G0271670-like [Trachymyrmex cornetzi]|uniref:Pro-resilin n=1 Tax=Trachymyrmex cornetzi TaxID=471704 RepID=A0A195E040_9HYME|nr:PREDICTED: uncharacterized protein DDB_G0271670-like [Trachymyrmex cornetzi]KYN18510.1 hypothetical protein ALC57_09190 [Trachymyrmex cornetzi]
MLLSAVVICYCMIAANAEPLKPPLNSYSFTSGINGYDYNGYSNAAASNGYLGSKDSYRNDGSFYGAFTGDINHKLPNHVGAHSLINIGNQGHQSSIGGNDVGNSYNGYSANDQGNEYAGYSNTYENSASEPYTKPTYPTSSPLRGHIDANNNGESIFNAYASDSTHKDSDFGQYTASSSSSSSDSSSSSSSSSNSNKRIPAYSGYSRPTRISDNYPESSTDNGIQGYLDSSGSSSYSESDHIYSPYSPGGLTSEHSFGKQKNDPLNLKGGNKHSGGIYLIPSGTRYTRGNPGHVSFNRDVPSFISGDSGLSSHFSQPHGIYSSGKLNKYGYKLSRYTPNSSATYVPRERDGYYTPYSKGSGKVIIIKNNKPNYAGRVYSEDPIYAGSNGGYRSKSFANGFSASSNFDGYTGSSNLYNDGPTVPRRYRMVSPVFVQKKSATYI